MAIDIDIDLLRSRAGEVAEMLKLMAHPNRLLIVCELLEGERSVSEIESRTGVMQPNLSRDLARLRALDLVKTRREAKQIYYSLSDDRVARLMEALCAAFNPACPTVHPQTAREC